MKSGNIPSFTVLEDSFEQPRPTYQPQKALWETQYASNVLSAPPNDPFSNYDVPQGMIDYDNHSPGTQAPYVAGSYDEAIQNNRQAAQTLRNFHLQAEAGLPLPGELYLPTMTPPYGTPYPSNGYSAFDSEMAMSSGVNSFSGLPGVPAASYAGLEDARSSPSVPLGPNHLYMLAEKHFKEGYKSAKEDYVPTCKDSIHHAISCSICKGYLQGDKKLMWMGIGVLIVIILILLWLLFRKSKIRVPLRSAGNLRSSPLRSSPSGTR